MKSAAADTEEAAIEACRRGRIDGLERLYRRYSQRVHRTCYRILGDLAAAEDATQEVFLRVFRRIGSFAGRSRFSTWLYRLTVHHALDLLEAERRRHRLGPLPDEKTAGSASVDRERGPEQCLLDEERENRMLRLVASLPPDARTIIVLRELEELSYREISEVLDVPMGTVMSRLSRSRAELRTRWDAFSRGEGISAVENKSNVKRRDR